MSSERVSVVKQLRVWVAGPTIIAGIRRRIPTYDLLGEEGLTRIEAAMDELLKEVGLDFRGDPRALELWRDAGAVRSITRT